MSNAFLFERKSFNRKYFLITCYSGDDDDLDDKIDDLEAEASAPGTVSKLFAFLKRLSECTTKQQADELAVEWFEQMINTKNNRKRL